MQRPTRATWLFISITLLLIVLAAGISGLQFQPGQEFNIQRAAPEAGVTPPASPNDAWLLFIRGVMMLLVITFVVYIVYMLLDSRRRKVLLAQLAIFALLIVVLLIIQRYLENRERVEPDEVMSMPSGPAMEELGSGEGGEVVEFTPPEDDWKVTVVAILAGSALVGAAGLAWWSVYRRSRQKNRDIQQIAEQAEESLDTLVLGGNIRETILRCYQRMTEVTGKSKGIFREASITPHEFEDLLTSKGLPRVAVHDLTTLFEEVRYGNLQADEYTRNRAIHALEQVILACRDSEKVAA